MVQLGLDTFLLVLIDTGTGSMIHCNEFHMKYNERMTLACLSSHFRG